MYVMIDRENLRFLMRHEEFIILCYFMIIQYPEREIDIQPCDCSTFLRDYTEFELGKLYEHCTLEKRNKYGVQMRAVLAELVKRLPIPDCSKFELERQSAELVDSTIPHTYVKGSFHASRCNGLFPDKIYKMVKHPQEDKVAQKGDEIYNFLYPSA